MNRRILAGLALAVAIAAAAAQGAGAAIGPAQTLDGPSAAIVDIGGAAMAEDGTGGLVYRRRLNGRAHVFAAQFKDGRWGQPLRVDTTNAFDSYWPRVGAALDGKLVVTWAQEFGSGSDRMYSAGLERGETRFTKPVPVDLNIGEASATYPALSMGRSGQAYLSYYVLGCPPVVPPVCPNTPPGYVDADVRIARYDGTLWSVLGAPADRNSVQPVRMPTAASAPKIGIDLNGNAVVAFQEPDDDFVDRVWARRVFGGSYGIPLLVSPQQYRGRPLRAAADQFDLDVAGFGQAAVAFRQLPASGSALARDQIFVNTMPEAFSDSSGKFAGARPLAGAGPDSPAVATERRGGLLAAFNLGTSVQAVEGDDLSLDRPERLDDGSSTVRGDPQVDLGSSGAAVGAWKLRAGGRSGVALLERRSDGVPQTEIVASRAGGPVNGLELGGSGLGDGIAAFEQGSQAAGQIAAAVVDAPPEEFSVLGSPRWLRSKRVRVSWEQPVNALGEMTYAVNVDDEAVAEDLERPSVVLGPGRLGDGVQRVEVVAREPDSDQETASRSASFRIDRRAPRVRVRVAGARVRVAVSDGPRRSTSGARRSATRIAFGDGAVARAATRKTHVYRHGGSFTVKVRVRDRAGNRATVKRRVRVG